MDEKVIAAIQLLMAAYAFQRTVDLGPLKDAVDALIAQLTPTLPAKADGTPWTEADVAAAAEAARQPWANVRAQNS